MFRAIEQAKVELSVNDSAAVVYSEGQIRLNERISLPEFEAVSQPLLRELGKCIDGLLQKAIGAGEVDAVFLTGGSSQIPAVRRLFVERFGEDRVRTADAFTSVAEGLGHAAGARFF